MSDWQPIETAPSDTPVRMGGYDRGYGDEPDLKWRTTIGVAWETETNWFGRKRRVRAWPPGNYTHWQPLPPPPENSTNPNGDPK